MKFRVFGFVFILFAIFGMGSFASAAITKVDCDKLSYKPISANLKSQLTCGFFEVPEDYSNPSGLKIPLFFIVTAPTLEGLASKDVIDIDYGGPTPGGPSMMMQELTMGSLQIRNNRVYVNVEQRHRKNGDTSTDYLYSTPHVARDIFSFMDEVGVSTFNFMGISYGGHVGVHLLQTDRSRIKKMILDSSTNVSTPRYQNDETNTGEYYVENLDEVFCRLYADCSYSNQIRLNDIWQKFSNPVQITFKGKTMNISAVEMQRYFYGFYMYTSPIPLLRKLLVQSESIVTEGDKRDFAKEFMGPIMDGVGGIMAQAPIGQQPFQQQESSPENIQGVSSLNLTFDCEFTLSGNSVNWAPARCLQNAGLYTTLSLQPNSETVPVLILSGGLDHITPSISIKELASVFSDRAFVFYLYSGHGVNINLHRQGCVVDVYSFFEGVEREQIAQTIRQCEADYKP